MSIGSIGVIRPSDVDVNDIDMFYNYCPDRYTKNTDIFKLDATEMLEQLTLPSENDDNYVIGNENLLEGLYDLRLPASIFNQLGIYTIYIKPKMISITIDDCSVLSALPTVKGIVINGQNLPEALRTNNALQGYRVEYLDSDGKKIRNFVRYIVTSNKVAVSIENVGDTNQKTQRYRFDDSAQQIFLQVTPSSSSDVKPNQQPYIGVQGQTILLSNTYFSPLVIEIDLVENTLDTISDLVGGEQIKNIQNGELTYYDKNRNITKQFNLYQIKDSTTQVPLFEVKEKKTTIDMTQEFDVVTDGI